MNEQAIVDAIRHNPGVLGTGLTDAQKERIVQGPKNEPENQEPFDGEKFLHGLETAFENHPLARLTMGDDRFGGWNIAVKNVLYSLP